VRRSIRFNQSFLFPIFKDGWTISANLALEINTANSITGYRTGDALHAEFQATKRIGKWTVGPVGYYVGQVTDDKSSAYYNNAINTNRFNIWAAGGLVGLRLRARRADVLMRSTNSLQFQWRDAAHCRWLGIRRA